MKTAGRWLANEWILFGALAALLASIVWLWRLPRFSTDEIQVLFLLWLLFATVKGLELSGLAPWVAHYLERSSWLSPKLVLITFFLAALVTNDVALVVIVPLTLAMDTDRKGFLVALEAFAANAGSALTPFGNPQNLYLYWHYGLQPLDFVRVISPFSLLFLALLLGSSLLVRVNSGVQPARAQQVERTAGIYVALLITLVLVVLKLLPFYFAYVTAIGLVAFGKRALRVDYGLLLTFLVFFGLVDNIQYVLAPVLRGGSHVFITAALSSQVIGNVPAALLLAEFTKNWPALLWGVSVGGFGSLIASFANLIAYRFFIHYQADAVRRRSFTLRFLMYGYLLFALGVGSYALLYGKL